MECRLNEYENRSKEGKTKRIWKKVSQRKKKMTL